MTQTLTPVQLAEEGKQKYRQGEYLEAARCFEAAAEGYRSAGDALSAAEMANNRSVALLLGRDPAGALEAVRGTEAVFAAAGDTRRQAMAFGNLGKALEGLNQLNEAMAAYEQAADLFKQIGEHDLRAPLLQSLAALQLRTGRQLESLATMQAGLNETQNPTPKQNLLRRLLRVPLRWLGL